MKFEFNPNAVTATFIRIEKKIDNYSYDVYEFYSVKRNGNMYVKRYEQFDSTLSGERTLGYIYNDRRIGNRSNKSEVKLGNELFLSKLKEGYKVVGKYESDILGCSRKIK